MIIKGYIGVENRGQGYSVDLNVTLDVNERQDLFAAALAGGLAAQSGSPLEALKTALSVAAQRIVGED